MLVVCVAAFSEYEKSKIDMHGGKNYNQFGSKSSNFGKMGIGMSALLDSNSSKRTKEFKKK